MDKKIELPYGHVEATLENCQYTVNFYTVYRSYRGQGYGKMLLRLALRDAIESKASVISGTVTSRESVQAAQAVFGEANVQIQTLGRFGQDDRPEHLRYGTLATVCFDLASAVNNPSLFADHDAAHHVS